ncbi:hypothetical protein WA158_001478 [Blastocystis sp. Blastoise]
MSSQKTLFSFFTVTPKIEGNSSVNQTPKEDKKLTPSASKNSSLKKVNSPSKVSSQVSPNSKNIEDNVISGVKRTLYDITDENSNSTIESSVKRDDRVEERCLGKRISVYWKDDDEWYDGVVTSQRGRQCNVKYDDGDEECIDITIEKYKIINDEYITPSKKSRIGEEAELALSDSDEDIDINHMEIEEEKSISTPSNEKQTPIHSTLFNSTTKSISETSESPSKSVNPMKTLSFSSPSQPISEPTTPLKSSYFQKKSSSITPSPSSSTVNPFAAFSINTNTNNNEPSVVRIDRSPKKEIQTSIKQISKEQDDEDTMIMKKSPKKQNKRKIVDSDEDDYSPPAASRDSDDEALDSLIVEEEEDDAPAQEDNKDMYKSPKKKTRKSPLSTPTTPKTPSFGHLIDEEPDQQDIEINTGILGKKESIVLPAGGHLHDSLDFILHPRDKYMHLPSHPLYDPSTLYIPPAYYKECTPALKQWWDFKVNYYDCILFFKMGKFYEFFHMDADIVIKELNLIYMKGEVAHCGFPEAAYSMYSQRMVQKGYKVARVEQTETPEQLKKRNLESPKGQKSSAVRREVCSIVSPGVSGHGTIDRTYNEKGSRVLCSIAEYREDHQGKLIPVGIKQKQEEQNTTSPVSPSSSSENSGITMEKMDLNSIKIGICISDTARGDVYIDEYTDDSQYTYTRTVLLRYMPDEVILCYPLFCLELKNLIKTECPSITYSITPYLYKKIEGNKGIEFIYNEQLFLEKEEEEEEEIKNNSFKEKEEWPKVLQTIVDMTQTPYQCLPSHLPLCSSLSLLATYLDRCRSAHLIFARKHFYPIQTTTAVSMENQCEFMEIDGDALRNLEIFTNNNDNTEDGSLYHYIDHSCTPFGKRLLREWVSRPLYVLDQINDRLDAVTWLISNPSFVNTLQGVLKGLPDMERLLSRVHDYGSIYLSRESAESRAVYFDQIKYNKIKINDFLTLLSSFESVNNYVIQINEEKNNFNSTLLSSLYSLPSLTSLLSFFDHAFDHSKAKEEGVIIPEKGVVPKLDKVDSQIDEITAILETHLEEVRDTFNCRKIVFFGNNKDRYQLQIPTESVDTHASILKREGYILKSQRKGVRRYWTPLIQESMEQLTKLEGQRVEILNDVMRSIFYKLYTNHKLLEQYITSLATLDCLLSLTHISIYGDNRGDMARPVFLQSNIPSIALEGARHPCVTHTYSNDVYIDNDTYLNTNNFGRCIIITGPNMGGKSTLLRQVCVNIILAQIGAYVPAKSLKMTLIDRIYTRIGARDSILSHQSTFFTELVQTHSLLTTSSSHSLAVIDELGRGTSTYDGAAIASAVLSYLTSPSSPLTMFSTHYNFIVAEFVSNPAVTIGHMACSVTTNNQGEEEVVFLYKFKQGNCEKSFGLNVARLAKLPQSVISRAHILSDALQTKTSTAAMSMDKYKSLYNHLQEIQSLSIQEKQEYIHNEIF